jgi:hypothetical protein
MHKPENRRVHCRSLAGVDHNGRHSRGDALNGLPGASKQVSANVQDVRLVCGQRGCSHELGPHGVISALGGGAGVTTGLDRCARKRLRAGPADLRAGAPTLCF